jgi:hypothetical protein
MSDIITVDVPEGKFFSLPFDVQQLFRVYGEPVRGPDRDTLRFSLAEYRWREIQSAIGGDAKQIDPRLRDNH